MVSVSPPPRDGCSVRPRCGSPLPACPSASVTLPPVVPLVSWDLRLPVRSPERAVYPLTGVPWASRSLCAGLCQEGHAHTHPRFLSCPPVLHTGKRWFIVCPVAEAPESSPPLPLSSLQPEASPGRSRRPPGPLPSRSHCPVALCLALLALVAHQPALCTVMCEGPAHRVVPEPSAAWGAVSLSGFSAPSAATRQLSGLACWSPRMGCSEGSVLMLPDVSPGKACLPAPVTAHLQGRLLALLVLGCAGKSLAVFRL